MENIVLERKFNPLLDQSGFYDRARETLGCLDIYRAEWKESFLARDGSSLICRFEAPDSESIRMMTRGDDSIEKVTWRGSVHDTGLSGLATVVVERRFDEPVTVESLQAIEDAASGCLELRRVTFLRSFFSADQKNMICLYQAPDAESVREAQQQAGMPVHRVWACQHYTPENMFT